MNTNDALQVLTTDALTGLRSLADNSVQVALTSPPFYLLRRYGTPTTWPDGWEGELGHEAHPNDFVRHLLSVFDEVRRVLRDDGCLWVNLGDTYNNKQGKKEQPTPPTGPMAFSPPGARDTPILSDSSRNFSNTTSQASATSLNWASHSDSIWR